MSPDPRVAVLGASGFLGNRIVEVLHLRHGWSVRPVVRRAAGLALAARLGIEGRVADGDDQDALREAFAGCDVVVHAVAAEPRRIPALVAPALRAAAAAGCRRVVYLSSAMVHGQSPASGTDESSPLPPDQRLAYNLAKCEAERRLFGLGGSLGLEVVALRPGIVWGPRSQWVGGLADALLEGRAGLVDGGAGLCNAIHADNVAHAVRLAATAPEAVGEAFLIADGTAPTWREFATRVAGALGIDAIPTLRFDARPLGLRDRIDGWRQSRAVQGTLDRLPRPLRAGLAAAWAASGALPPEAPPGPVADLEMALLHRAPHVPRWDKARTRLGYAPVTDVEEGWRQCRAWLAFAGYPVVAP